MWCVCFCINVGFTPMRCLARIVQSCVCRDVLEGLKENPNLSGVSLDISYNEVCLCVCVSVCTCVCMCMCVYASVFVYLLILHNLLPPAAGSRVSERGCSSPSWCSLLVWPQHSTQWWDTCGNYINVSTVGLYPMCCCIWDSCKTYNSEYVRQLSSSVVDPLLPWMLHLCTYGRT